MAKDFDRRVVLKGLALATPAVIAACGEAPPPTPTEVDTAPWPRLDLAAEQPYDLTKYVPQLSTDIGMKEFYLISSSSVPYVFAIFTFDRNTAKAPNARDISPTLRSRLKGVIDLQPVDNQFTPRKPQFTPDDPKALVDPLKFSERALNAGGELLDNRGWPPSFAGFIHKPADETKPTTIVIGEGTIAYKDNPSPQTYFKVKFTFGSSSEQLVK